MKTITITIEIPETEEEVALATSPYREIVRIDHGQTIRFGYFNAEHEHCYTGTTMIVSTLPGMANHIATLFDKSSYANHSCNSISRFLNNGPQKSKTTPKHCEHPYRKTTEG